MSFFSIYRQGFVRIAACTPRIEVNDPAANAAETLRLVREGHERAVALMLFPELGLSAYAIDDLLFQDALLDGVEAEIGRLAEASRELMPAIVVGAPLRHENRLYNTAVVIHRGRVLGAVPKTFLPNYREFYEKRHFASGRGVRGATLALAGQSVPFGTDLLFVAEDVPDFVTHVEICEDFWAAIPPSSAAALNGALVLLNLSASNITIAKAETRRLLCQSQSARCLAAYAYSAAGPGESTTDLAWDGQASIYENGELLAETERFPLASQMAVADLDLDRLRQERMRLNTFGDAREADGGASFRRITFRLDPPVDDVGFERRIERFPFVPSARERLDQDCYEAYSIQVHGLMQRLAASATRRLVIGVSGGLDSTQALIVAARAFDLLERPRADILAYTLPGFATGERTKANAWRLMTALGVTASEIDIKPAARQMLGDLGHPFATGEPVYDVTFENVQAGLRTDYLFRFANQNGGLVLGTGDLSELALGWATYGVGDHMSHYNVNAGVPKTLIQYLIRWVVSTKAFEPEVGETLSSILETEISPELVPAGADGAIQSTQAKIGPYELQDFNLYYTLRYGLRPSKIAFLAYRAWADREAGTWPVGYPEHKRRAYDLPTIKRWLEVFLFRFFTISQFKRSALPNGPKVSPGGSLSPRGDWRAPSDGNARVFLDELRRNVPDA